jgi:hypothetical protein
VKLPAERGEGRFLALCGVALVVFAAVGYFLFPKAFPEASLELRVTRRQAAVRARDVLVREAGAPPEVFAGASRSGWHEASRFAVDTRTKTYLERTLGLQRANRLFGREAKIWRWDLRWYRSLQKEEWRASVTPRGDFVSFDHEIPESAPGARLDAAEAERRARAYLRRRGLDAAKLSLREAEPRERPARTDWSFVFESPGPRLGDATVRYEVRLQGGSIGAFREFVQIPERWVRGYRRLRSANDAASSVDAFFLILTGLAMAAVLVSRALRRDVPWKIAGAFAAVAFVLALLSLANEVPVDLFDYDTASPYSAYLVSLGLTALLSAAGQGVLIGGVVAAGEPVFRERFPGRLSVAGVFSRRGLGTRNVFRGIVLGYTLTAFFFAYQAVFYVVASHFGAWAPADIPYDDMLNTAFPWVTVLFMGFFPAVSEEFVSRIFSISFLRPFVKSRFLLLLVPALIWGFGHAGYPNQPFYIRGVEVGAAGVLLGAVFLRWGIVPILVWHFTVDAVYTALILLRSGNLYYVVTGGLAAGILSVPLVAAAIARRRRGRFQPTSGLTNADLGSAAPPPRVFPEPAEAPGTVSVVSRRVRSVAIVLVAALSTLFLLPARGREARHLDRIGRRGALAAGRAFLSANGEDPSRFRSAAYTATGFAEDRDMESAAPEETGRLAGFSEDAALYVLGHGGWAAYDRLSDTRLPTDLWAVRFFAPGRKEEWKLLVRANTGLVAAFAHPIAEDAPAAPPPSPDAARRRAVEAAARLGYPAGSYRVADSGTRVRPKRTDTSIRLEDPSAAAGAARPRLTAVFHGSRLAALYPSLRVPESYLRQRQKRSAFDWALLLVRLAAISLLAGILLWVVASVLRRPGFRWRRLLGPAAVLAFFGAVRALDAAPLLWRSYRTEIPLAHFRFISAAVFGIQMLLAVSAALIAAALFDAAAPGWRRPPSNPRRVRNALIRGAAAALGLAAIDHLPAILARFAPRAFPPDPGLPGSLDGALPLAAIAAAAAAIALARKIPRFAGRPIRVGAVSAAVLLLVPSGAGSLGSAALPALVGLAAGAWLAFSAFGLLREDAASWIAFGLFGPALSGAALLAAGASADRFQAALVVGISAVLFAMFVLRRNRA